jgi:hypothetical protein
MKEYTVQHLAPVINQTAFQQSQLEAITSNKKQITSWVQYVIFFSNNVDGLPLQIKYKNEVNTRSAVNNFYYFWEHVQLEQHKQPKFYALH